MTDTATKAILLSRLQQLSSQGRQNHTRPRTVQCQGQYMVNEEKKSIFYKKYILT